MATKKPAEKAKKEERKMYNVICDECKRKCQVPFEPKKDKPVYCEECYRKRRERNRFSNRPRRFPQNNQSSQAISQLMNKIDVLNTKLDKIIQEASREELKEKAKPNKKKIAPKTKTSKTKKSKK